MLHSDMRVQYIGMGTRVFCVILFLFEHLLVLLVWMRWDRGPKTQNLNPKTLSALKRLRQKMRAFKNLCAVFKKNMV